MGLSRYLFGRVLSGVAVLLATSALLFWAVTMLPGDPATRILGMGATPEQVVLMRDQLGLDAPALQRYADWLGGVLRFDLGSSLISRSPVSELIAPRLVNSAVLAGAAALLGTVIALAAGVLAGSRPGSRRDRRLSTVALAGVSVPDFVLAGALVSLVGLGLGWLPSTALLTGAERPWDRPDALVLPVLSLALPVAAWLFRYVRAGVATAVTSPSVEAARLAGLSPWVVITRHLMPSALPNTLPAFGYALAGLLGGGVVVERLFGYPGVGLLLVDSVGGRDAPVVLAVGVLLSAAVICALTLTDVAAAALDPRVRRVVRR